MTTLRINQQVTSTVLQHWWYHIRRDHRLALRLMSEKPAHLHQLKELKLISNKIDGIRLRTLRADYPKATQEVRSYLLSAEHHFLLCLRALQRDQLHEAEIHYSRVQDDLSLLRYILMEQGVQSYL